MAQRLARRGGIAAIVSSDLPRAWLTAEAMAAALALPIQPSALLQERNFGDLRGRPYDSLGFDPLVMARGAAGRRVGRGLRAARAARPSTDMLQQHAGLDGDLLVVTHGLLIRTLLAGPLHAGRRRRWATCTWPTPR